MLKCVLSALPRAAGAQRRARTEFWRAVARRPEPVLETRLGSEFLKKSRRIESTVGQALLQRAAAVSCLCRVACDESGAAEASSAIHVNYSLYGYSFAVKISTRRGTADSRASAAQDRGRQLAVERCARKERGRLGEGETGRHCPGLPREKLGTARNDHAFFCAPMCCLIRRRPGLYSKSRQ